MTMHKVTIIFFELGAVKRLCKNFNRKTLHDHFTYNNISRYIFVVYFDLCCVNLTSNNPTHSIFVISEINTRH